MYASDSGVDAESAATPAPSGQTVLVTGGAGFVGSHIAAALAADNDVRVLDDLSTGRLENLPDDVAFREGDVRDPGTLRRAMDGVDLVFHEAGLVSVPRSVELPCVSHDCNARATLSLLERAREVDARVVLASSVAIYGHPESVPVHEGDPKEPTSPYGLDKLAIDHYARLYHDLYDLETVALRYFNVYGPGQRAGDYSGVVSTFVERALAGEDLVVHGDGTQTRDFVHVSDVVRANLAAATVDETGFAVNVGTGQSVTIRELAETVRDAAGSDSAVVHGEGRAGDVERSRADVSRARRRLGYEPQVALAEGLSELVRTWEKAGE